jgi:glycogen(starch) synthase
VTRVALLPSSYLPALGGVEELTRHLALSLREQGDEVEIWTAWPHRLRGVTREERDGLTVRRFAMPLPAASLGATLSALTGGATTLAELARATAEFRPELLHIQCFGPNGVYGLALARITGRPLLVTLQGETVMDDDDVFEHSHSLRLGLRSALRHAQSVTACSAFTLRDAEARFGLTPGRGRVIPNGVDLRITPERPATPTAIPRERPYVLALGRIVEKKGFDLLLRAFARTTAASRLADLVIAGDGGALPHLRRLAAELGVDQQVRFPGRLAREEVAAAMADAVAFVMPSRLEPFGIVVLEAWRAGCPVIVTSKGGPPEFVQDGHDGLLVDPTDIAALAHALDELVRDPDRRAQLRAHGLERVGDFAWPTIAARYQEIYRQIARSVIPPRHRPPT